MRVWKKNTKFLTGLVFLIAGALGLQAQVKFPLVIAFGDSLSDAGNKALCTNPASASGLHLGGTWVQQLAMMYGDKLTPSRLGGTDYANAGAVSGNLTYQVQAYLAANGGSASPTALYTFFVGSNDIFFAALHGLDTAAVATRAADNVKVAIETLAKAGGKNFVWLNMFPINATPVWKGRPDCAPAVSAFNWEWTVDVAALRKTHPDLKLVSVDFYAFALASAANPADEGFANSTQAWLTAPASTPYARLSSNPNADKFVFFDGLHPTTHFDQLLASAVFRDLQAP